MSNTTEVFFYGLFMDEEILRKNGVNPTNPRKASLADYGLRIGERATLLPSAGEISYGLVMTIDNSELEPLYSENSVADYVPEGVTVKTDQDEWVEATCYNLPEDLVTGSNPSYAKSLLELAKSLNLPDSYLKQIEEIAGSG